MTPATPPCKAANQSKGKQCNTRWLGDALQWLGIKKIVHNHNVVIRVAQRPIGDERILALSESNPANPLTGIGNRTHKAQSLVSRDQRVSRENGRVALVEELDLRLSSHFDIDEDRGERAGGGSRHRTRRIEQNISDGAADRSEQPLRTTVLTLNGGAAQVSKQ